MPKSYSLQFRKILRSQFLLFCKILLSSDLFLLLQLFQQFKLLLKPESNSGFRRGCLTLIFI